MRIIKHQYSWTARRLDSSTCTIADTVHLQGFNAIPETIDHFLYVIGCIRHAETVVSVGALLLSMLPLDDDADDDEESGPEVPDEEAHERRPGEFNVSTALQLFLRKRLRDLPHAELLALLVPLL